MLKRGTGMLYGYYMPRIQKTTDVASAAANTASGLSRPLTREQVIRHRARAAKGRETGIDVTDISDEDLLADLRRRQVSV